MTSNAPGEPAVDAVPASSSRVPGFPVPSSFHIPNRNSELASPAAVNSANRRLMVMTSVTSHGETRTVLFVVFPVDVVPWLLQKKYWPEV